MVNKSNLILEKENRFRILEQHDHFEDIRNSTSTAKFNPIKIFQLSQKLKSYIENLTAKGIQFLSNYLFGKLKQLPSNNNDKFAKIQPSDGTAEHALSHEIQNNSIDNYFTKKLLESLVSSTISTARIRSSKNNMLANLEIADKFIVAELQTNLPHRYNCYHPEIHPQIVCKMKSNKKNLQYTTINKRNKSRKPIKYIQSSLKDSNKNMPFMKSKDSSAIRKIVSSSHKIVFEDITKHNLLPKLESVENKLASNFHIVSSYKDKPPKQKYSKLKNKLKSKPKIKQDQPRNHVKFSSKSEVKTATKIAKNISNLKKPLNHIPHQDQIKRKKLLTELYFQIIERITDKPSELMNDKKDHKTNKLSMKTLKKNQNRSKINAQSNELENKKHSKPCPIWSHNSSNHLSLNKVLSIHHIKHQYGQGRTNQFKNIKKINLMKNPNDFITEKHYLVKHDSKNQTKIQRKQTTGKKVNDMNFKNIYSNLEQTKGCNKASGNSNPTKKYIISSTQRNQISKQINFNKMYRLRQNKKNFNVLSLELNKNYLLKENNVDECKNLNAGNGRSLPNSLKNTPEQSKSNLQEINFIPLEGENRILALENTTEKSKHANSKNQTKLQTEQTIVRKDNDINIKNIYSNIEQTKGFNKASGNSNPTKKQKYIISSTRKNQISPQINFNKMYRLSQSKENVNALSLEFNKNYLLKENNVDECKNMNTKSGGSLLNGLKNTPEQSISNVQEINFIPLKGENGVWAFENTAEKSKINLKEKNFVPLKGGENILEKPICKNETEILEYNKITETPIKNGFYSNPKYKDILLFNHPKAQTLNNFSENEKYFNFIKIDKKCPIRRSTTFEFIDILNEVKFTLSDQLDLMASTLQTFSVFKTCLSPFDNFKALQMLEAKPSTAQDSYRNINYKATKYIKLEKIAAHKQIDTNTKINEKLNKKVLKTLLMEFSSLRLHVNVQLFLDIRDAISSNSLLGSLEVRAILSHIDTELIEIKNLNDKIDKLFQELKYSIIEYPV